MQIGHSPTCADYQNTSVVLPSPVFKPTFMYIETIKFYHGQKIKFYTVTVIILVARSKNLNVFLQKRNFSHVVIWDLPGPRATV